MKTNESMPGGQVIRYRGSVTRQRRESLNGHRALVVWFTGLSGAGKSTLAHAVEEVLHRSGCRTYVLDGDNVRHGLCSDLGFTPGHREENMRRIGEMARLFVDAGTVVLAAFISPLNSHRQMVREMFATGDFIEVHLDCPLEVCASRDVKGMYARARAGLIADFTGVSAPYEKPVKPELVLDTSTVDLSASVTHVLRLLRAQGLAC